MIYTTVARFLHLQSARFAGEKSLLATLRKKTGYTFANCKKALEIHNNDLTQAERWLQEQAQAMGWSKATKLEGRQTLQGLIAVAVNSNNAVLVEVNCETDFVARNKEFQRVVEESALSCLDFTRKQEGKGSLLRFRLSAEQLKSLNATDGKPLADHLALMIGTVGENASLRRALCFKADEGIHLTGYAHPSGTQCGEILLGRVGGVVALKPTASKDIDLEDVGKELCQHIVGMNPKKVGSDKDEPAKNKDEEICLIHQEFLLDDSVTVKDILDESSVQVVDFQRFECGERIDTESNQTLDFVETCQ